MKLDQIIKEFVEAVHGVSDYAAMNIPSSTEPRIRTTLSHHTGKS